VPAVGAGLPDGRAYELVSPTEKNGYNVRAAAEPGESFVVAAETGRAVDYQSLGAFPSSPGNPQAGSPSNPLVDLYMASAPASNQGGSWMTAALGPALPNPTSTFLPGAAGFEFVSSAHLAQPVYNSDEPLAPQAPPSVANQFVREPDGNMALVTTSAPPVSERGFYASEVLSGAGEPLRLLVSASGALTPEAPLTNSPQILYDWAAGMLHLTAILPDGEPAPPGTSIKPMGNPISTDGARIAFVNSGHIYDRREDMATAEVSASRRVPPDPLGSRPATFWLATPDGSDVFFTSCEKLTNDSTAVGTMANCHRIEEATEPYEGTDLYRWHEDPSTHATELKDLTLDATDPAGASVQGVVGTSDDGSYVYFVAEGALAAGASAGAKNLYVWHEDATTHTATTTLVAILGEGDGADWRGLGEGFLGARVTPDGAHLAFMSASSSLAADTDGGYGNLDAGSGTPDSEVYEYSAATHALVCASCDPSGAPPVGNATLTYRAERGGYVPRNLSADGSRLFFESPDPLIPGSANGHIKVFELATGTVYLLSSGTSTANDYFGDASANGEDAFIVTASQLVPRDTDTLYDLYDVRAGATAEAPPIAPAACAADSCQGAPNLAPVFAAPASATLLGAGNLVPAAGSVAGPTTRQLLASALRACRAKRNRSVRARCERSARRRYRKKAKAGGAAARAHRPLPRERSRKGTAP
jgi:hypothetical protein